MLGGCSPTKGARRAVRQQVRLACRRRYRCGSRIAARRQRRARSGSAVHGREVLRRRSRLPERLPDLYTLLRRRIKAGSRQGILDLRSGGDLHQDRRWQSQENLTQASSGVAIVTKDQPIPCCNPGIGLRSQHAAEIAASRPKLGFLEVHAENYMAETVALDRLLELRRDYPVSVHGVALSLGSAEALDRVHLGRFKRLIERVQPVLVSEHLAWTAIGGAYLNDL